MSLNSNADLDLADLDETHLSLTRAESGRYIVAVLLPTFVGLIAVLTGFAPLLPGGRGWTACFLLPLYLGVFHAALVWPLKHARFLPTPEHPERLLAAIALSAIPLFSFTYFMGTYHDVSQAWDAAIAVLPPLVTGWLAFRRTGREAWFAALAGGGTFLTLFAFNDGFGPFRTVVACAPYGQLFHSLRTLAAFGGIALVSLSLAPDRASLRRGLALLSIGSVAVDFVLPAVLAAFAVDEKILPTHAWIGFVAALYFLFRPTAFARKAFVAIAGLQVLVVAFRLSLHLFRPEATLGAQAQLAIETLALGYFGSVVASAWRERRSLRITAPSALRA